MQEPGWTVKILRNVETFRFVKAIFDLNVIKKLKLKIN